MGCIVGIGCIRTCNCPNYCIYNAKNSSLTKRTAYSCKESQRLELNTDTGDLKIRNVQLSDEDDYYYFCGIEKKWPSYELMKLEVQGKCVLEIKLELCACPSFQYCVSIEKETITF